MISDSLATERTSIALLPLRFSVLFVQNSAECPLGATTPTQLSNGSGVNDDPNNSFNSTWTGSIDTISRAAGDHFIGTKLSDMGAGFLEINGVRSAMVDGQTVDFNPTDVNDKGVVVGTRNSGNETVIRTIPVPPLAPVADVILPGVSPLAVNAHVRAPAAQPSPSASPQPTPVPAPQVLSWDGPALVLRELQEDQTWFPFGLEDMIMDGWEIFDVTDINDNGMIVGTGSFKNPANPQSQWENHAFMLVPIKTVYAFFGSSAISSGTPPSPNPDANLTVLNTYLGENRYEATPQIHDALCTFDGEHPGAECSVAKSGTSAQVVRVFTYNCIRANRATGAVAMQAMKDALATDGAYVTFNGHANMGAGPAFTLDVGGLSGFMHVSNSDPSKPAAVSEAVLQEEHYAFTLRPYEPGDPDNEILESGTNYLVPIVNKQRFPGVPLNATLHIQGSGSTAYHFETDIRSEPENPVQMRKFALVKGSSSDLPVVSLTHAIVDETILRCLTMALFSIRQISPAHSSPPGSL